MYDLILIFHLPSFGVKHSLRFVRSKGVVLPDHLVISSLFSSSSTVSTTKKKITHTFTNSIINTI